MVSWIFDVRILNSCLIAIILVEDFELKRETLLIQKETRRLLYKWKIVEKKSFKKGTLALMHKSKAGPSESGEKSLYIWSVSHKWKRDYRKKIPKYKFNLPNLFQGCWILHCHFSFWVDCRISYSDFQFSRIRKNRNRSLLLSRSKQEGSTERSKNCHFGWVLCNEKFSSWLNGAGANPFILDWQLFPKHIHSIQKWRHKNGSRVTWKKTKYPQGVHSLSFLYQNGLIDVFIRGQSHATFLNISDCDLDIYAIYDKKQTLPDKTEVIVIVPRPETGPPPLGIAWERGSLSLLLMLRVESTDLRLWLGSRSTWTFSWDLVRVAVRVGTRDWDSMMTSSFDVAEDVHVIDEDELSESKSCVAIFFGILCKLTKKLFVSLMITIEDKKSTSFI